jgi:hypothetical protein
VVPSPGFRRVEAVLEVVDHRFDVRRIFGGGLDLFRQLGGRENIQYAERHAREAVREDGEFRVHDVTD